jgi:hypothetical protein
VVFAVPILLPVIGCSLAQELAPLFALPKEIEGPSNTKQHPTEDIEVDPDIKTAILELCDLCEEILISASETRLIALRTHEALVNAHVPGYLEAHESIAADSRVEQLERELKSSIESVLKRVRKAL